MTVRRKAGNVKSKKHQRTHNDFFLREKRINSLMGTFKNNYYNMRNPPTVEEYKKMNSLRNEIKRLLDIQGSELYRQNYRRRRFYYEQVDNWKIIYPRWKRRTYYIYLHLRFGVPFHLFTGLSWFKRTKVIAIKNI